MTVEIYVFHLEERSAQIFECIGVGDSDLRDPHSTSFSVQSRCKDWIPEGNDPDAYPRRSFKNSHLESCSVEFKGDRELGNSAKSLL